MRARRDETEVPEVIVGEPPGMDLWAGDRSPATRLELAQAVLTAALARDDAADALDALADQQERDLDLAQMLSRASTAGYGDDWPARRHAMLDRERAKAERLSSREDMKALVATCRAGSVEAQGPR